MVATTKPFLALTAADLMCRDVTTIPYDVSLHAAADLLFQHRIGGAPVVNAEGRCIGMLSARDIVHWAKEGAKGLDDVPLPACPYQVKGRLLSGEEAVICTLAEGGCPLQEMRPTLAGGHTAVCLQPHGVVSDWQQVAEHLPTAGVRHYMTANVVTVGEVTPLAELAQTMIDAHIHRLVVVDAQHRPIGIVSSTDVLAALAASQGRPVRHPGAAP
jgi:CBS domain-containing protein